MIGIAVVANRPADGCSAVPVTDDVFKKCFTPLGLLVPQPRTGPEIAGYVDAGRLRWGPGMQRLKRNLD